MFQVSDSTGTYALKVEGVNEQIQVCIITLFSRSSTDNLNSRMYYTKPKPVGDIILAGSTAVW